MDAFYHRYFPHDGDACAAYLREVSGRLSMPGRVLDLGCGDNTQLAGLRYGGHELWGADFQSHPRLAHPEWFRLLDKNGVIPFPDETFDLVGCCWVLEHVRAPEAFLAEVQRVLRPGGQLVALSVNAGHYVAWLSRLAGALPHAVTQTVVQRLYGRRPRDTFPTWYRLNTPSQLRRLARRSNLEVVAFTRFANPDYFSFSPTLQKGAVLLDWFLDRIGTPFGKLYFVTVLRKGTQAFVLPFPSQAA